MWLCTVFDWSVKSPVDIETTRSWIDNVCKQFVQMRVKKQNRYDWFPGNSNNNDVLSVDIYNGKNIIFVSPLNRSNWRVCSSVSFGDKREFRKLFSYAKLSLHNDSPFCYGDIAVSKRAGVPRWQPLVGGRKGIPCLLFCVGLRTSQPKPLFSP